MMDYGTVIATSLITGLLNVALWLLITRSVSRRDKLVDELQDEVKNLRDEKLVTLSKHVDDGRESRKYMHQQIDTLGRTVERHGEHLQRIGADLSGLKDTELKLASTVERVNLALDRVEALSAQQSAMSEKLAATAALVNQQQHGGRQS